MSKLLKACGLWLALISLPRPAVAAVEPDSDAALVRSLAAANQRAIEQIKTVEAAYTWRRWRISPERRVELTGNAGRSEIEWWSRGQSHRIRTRHTSRGTLYVRDECYHDGQVLSLSGYDWEDPRDMSPFDRSAQGSIDTLTRQTRWAYPQAQFLLLVQCHPLAVARTLSELLRDATGPASVERIEHGGATLYRIDVREPESNRRLQMDVDPHVNYLVRRMMVYATPAERSDQSTPLREDVVTEFTEVSPGVFFPGAVRIRAPLEKPGEYRESLLSFSRLKVNEPLDDVFNLQFPENVTVHNRIDNTTHIWGDGRSAYTIRSRLHAEFLYVVLRFHTAGLVTLGTATALGVLFASLVVIRRCRRRAAART